jgi:predicted site-specific integrase-resolvase
MSTPEPLSLRQFAECLGVKETTLLTWCNKGRIFGARKHPLTKKWWIYPPAKILPRA